MKNRKLLVTAGLIVGIIVTVLSLKAFLSFRQKQLVFSRKAARSLGNPKAKVSIVEYTDFQCPACANGSVILKEYLTRYPEQIYLEYRHFPLEMHPKAMSIAIAAECAAWQNKFWSFHNMVFERQGLLRESINLSQRLKEIAELAGLNQKEFEQCLTDPRARQAVEAERDEGRARNIKATPTYFLNRDKMVVGHTALSQELDRRLGGQ